jgi:hypothetical protein
MNCFPRRTLTMANMDLWNHVCMYARDVCSVSKLSVFVLMIYDNSMNKEQLNTVLLLGQNRGDNVFQTFCTSLLKINVPIRINLCHSPQMDRGTRLTKRLAYCALLEIPHSPVSLFIIVSLVDNF